jgi:prephenate dehydratase
MIFKNSWVFTNTPNNLFLMTKQIAFQGTYGANSDLACRDFYPDCKTTSCPSFLDVFKMVESGEAEYGMIPLENSYAGRVSEIHNLLQNSNVFIVSEHFCKIEHHLVGLKGSKIQDIKEVYSHPQALMQCKNSLTDIDASQHNYSNTANAAKFIKESNDKSKAALCSKLAAQINDLDVIQSNLEDTKEDNMTVFVVISKTAIDPDPQDDKKIITTMLFTVRNIPGSLYKALGGFATNNVNMLKLESYIPGGISKQAKFFISIEGHPNQRNISLALEEIGFFSKKIKVLGVYYADQIRFID